MNTTTLNMTTLDGGVIIKKGGGGGSTPPSGGADGNLEYLDVSNIADLAEGFLYFLLAYSSKTTKAVEYNEEDDMFVYGIYPALLYELSPVVAVAVDLQEVISIHDEYNNLYIEATLRDFIIMTGQSYGFDNIEELLDSVPRITKEEFYAPPEKPKKPLMGAYIQHIDGTLYTGNQWTAKGFSNDEANGVAVINETENISLVVAKDSLGKLPWSSMPDTLIEGITTVTNYDEVEDDRAGVRNTAIIAAADPNSAASACANYTFPNGQKGYLVAFGESFAIENNDTLLELIGGTPLGDVYIWTSTQYNAEKAWERRVNGLFDHNAYPKSNNFEVRPVCTLDNYTFIE